MQSDGQQEIFGNVGIKRAAQKKSQRLEFYNQGLTSGTQKTRLLLYFF
jgi:hypothetical protein